MIRHIMTRHIKQIGYSLLFLLPSLILTITASYVIISTVKQGRMLRELQLVVDARKPVVTSRAELENMFKQFLISAGIKPAAEATASKSDPLTGNTKTANDWKPETDTERVYGNPDAQFYLIEYTDFECPYCKEHFPQLIKLVDASHGNIALIFKHVPAHGQASATEALAAECAAQQGGNPAFFSMAKSIFAASLSDGRGLSVPLDKLAQDSGLDPQRLIECVNSQQPAKKIADDLQEAAGLSIEQTPSTIVVHGEKSALVQGAVSGTGIMEMMSQLAGNEAQ